MILISEEARNRAEAFACSYEQDGWSHRVKRNLQWVAESLMQEPNDLLRQILKEADEWAEETGQSEADDPAGAILSKIRTYVEGLDK